MAVWVQRWVGALGRLAIAGSLALLLQGCGAGDGGGDFSREFEKPTGEATASKPAASEKRQSRKEAIQEDRERPASKTPKKR